MITITTSVCQSERLPCANDHAGYSQKLQLSPRYRSQLQITIHTSHCHVKA